MITRRGLLGGILVAGVAPAIIKLDRVMGLWVPDPRLQLLRNGKIGHIDGFTVYSSNELCSSDGIHFSELWAKRIVETFYATTVFST